MVYHDIHENLFSQEITGISDKLIRFLVGTAEAKCTIKKTKQIYTNIFMSKSALQKLIILHQNQIFGWHNRKVWHQKHQLFKYNLLQQKSPI